MLDAAQLRQEMQQLQQKMQQLRQHEDLREIVDPIKLKYKIVDCCYLKRFCPQDPLMKFVENLKYERGSWNASGFLINEHAEDKDSTLCKWQTP